MKKPASDVADAVPTSVSWLTTSPSRERSVIASWAWSM